MARRYSIQVAAPRPREGTAWERAQHWFAIAGPIGLIPWVPATFASLATAAAGWATPPRPTTVLGLTAALFFVGGFAASTAERLAGETDPRNVVVDEVAGQLLSFVFVAPLDWQLALAGFVLFRLFDVLKPWPVHLAERLPRGWGIMADDLLAGLYAATGLWALAWWLR